MGNSDGLFPVKPGEYTIVLDLDGHLPHEETVTVRDGRITRIVLELEARSKPDLSGAGPLYDLSAYQGYANSWRRVGQKVSNFSDAGRSDTPEAAFAIYHRAIARGDDYERLVHLSCVTLSYPALDKLYPTDLERYWVSADDNESETVQAYNKAILDGEIVGVLDFRGEIAAIVCRPKSPPGEGKYPFTRRFFCRIDGEWKNLGEDRLTSTEPLMATFIEKAAMLHKYAFTLDAELLDPAESDCRRLIATLVKACRESDRKTAAKCLSSSVHVDSTLDDMQDVIEAGVDPANVRVVKAVGDHAMVATEFSIIRDKKYRDPVCVFYTLVRQDGTWLIQDIDLEDAEGLATETRRFKTEHGGEDASLAAWTCPMHQQIKQSEPGKCPICTMDLIRASKIPTPEPGADGLIQSRVLTLEFKRLLRELMAKQAEAGDRVPDGWDTPEFISTMAEEFKKENPGAFSVTPAMERKFGEGKFDAESLSEQITRTIKILSDFGVDLPALSGVLVERFESGEHLSGAKLEVTARVLRTHVSRLTEKIKEPDAAGEPAATRPKSLTVDIDRKGSLSINGKPFDEQSLADALRITAAGEVSPTVVLGCHRELPYQRLLEVLGVLKAAGIEPIAFFTPAPLHTAKLGFRIAPTKEALGLNEMNRYATKLHDHGPAARRDKDEFGWFAMDDTPQASLVPSEYQGQMYLLLSNRPDEVMLYDDDGWVWEIKEVVVSDDASGRPSIRLTLDWTGASRMLKLTGANLNHHLAVVLDDRVICCPAIRSTIGASIAITGNFTLEEARRLADSLRSGAVAPAAEIAIEDHAVSADRPPSDPSTNSKAAKAQILAIRNALDMFRLDNGEYPTTSQGLQSLIDRPNDLPDPGSWSGPYVKSVPVDPWGTPYQYEHQGDNDSPRIWSLGPDAVDGTGDDL